MYFLSRFAILLGLFLKPLGLGAELNSAPNPSGSRNNPSNKANPDRKYHENPLGKPVFWAQVALFVRSPLLKIAPFDAKLNSAPNSNGFRNNPSNIANPDKKSRIWC
jgi:hypothetical protein